MQRYQTYATILKAGRVKLYGGYAVMFLQSNSTFWIISWLAPYVLKPPYEKKHKIGEWVCCKISVVSFILHF